MENRYFGGHSDRAHLRSLVDEFVLNENLTSWTERWHKVVGKDWWIVTVNKVQRKK